LTRLVELSGSAEHRHRLQALVPRGSGDSSLSSEAL
jgi:hypothetical protein